MDTLTLMDRARLYNTTFARFPDSSLRASDKWLSGIWILGNDYRGTGLYGSYPPGYLPRIYALFPDRAHTLHLFGGSLPRVATAAEVTVDLRCTPDTDPPVVPGVQADALALPFVDGAFDLVIADPPYSDDDAKRYGTKMPDRRLTLYEAHRVVQPGGFLVWLDCSMPMFAKTHWQWCGVVGVWRSTNHRIRGVMVFQRNP